jgi:hypothetical protein
MELSHDTQVSEPAVLDNSHYGAAMLDDQQEYHESGFYSISISNLFKLAKALFREIQADLVQNDLLGYTDSNGKFQPFRAPLKNLDNFCDMSSDHVRIYFLKHRIHPHIQYPQYFSKERALIVLTYQWSISFGEMEDYFSEESIDNFNIVHSGKCDEIPLNLELATIWVDIFFNYQCAKDFESVLDNSEAQYRECIIHCALGTKDLFTRGFCLLELAIRNDAGKTTGILESCRREAGGKLDARSQEPVPRPYFKEMAVTNPRDMEKIKERILKIFTTPCQFNLLVHDMRITMTRMMAGSISIENINKLTQRIIEDARGMGYDDWEGEPTSEHLSKFFKHNKIDPKLKYSEYYNPEPPTMALSCHWKRPLPSIALYFSDHSISRFNTRYGRECGKLSSRQEATVWIDVLFKNEFSIDNIPRIARLLERQFRKSKFHCVLDDEVVWRRGWVLWNITIREEAGGRTGVLHSLDTHAAVAAREALVERDYFEEMQCADPSEVIPVRQRALRVFGSPARFNGYIASVRRAVDSDGASRIAGVQPLQRAGVGSDRRPPGCGERCQVQ